MDTRKLLTSAIIFGALFLAINYFFSPKKGAPAAAGPTAVPYALNITTQPAAEKGAVPQRITLGDASRASKDKLAVTVDNVTAGIDLVQLNVNDYAETLKKQKPFTLLEAEPGLPKPYATLSVHVSGAKLGIKDYDLGQAQYTWKIIKQNLPTEVVMQMTGTDKQMQPIFVLTKTFQIDPNSYSVKIWHTVKNLTNEPISVTIDQLASNDLPRDNPRGDDRTFITAVLGSKKVIKVNQVEVTHAQIAKFTGSSKDLGAFSGATPTLWVASENRFFAAITRPEPTGANPVKLEDGREIQVANNVADARVDILRAGIPANDPTTAVTAIHLAGQAITVPAGGSEELALSVYLGPKKKDILDGQYGAAPGTHAHEYNLYAYTQVIHVAEGEMCWFCTFDFLAFAILALLNFLFKTIAFHNYGVAIMLLVIIVRAILHPLTRASQVNMAVMAKKMKDIQPQLNASKKRYADDKKKIQEEQMRIYKENNVNPAGSLLGCLPMLLQTPIWIALYAGLRVDIDLRHASFIPGWINDLSNPDTIWPHPVPGIGHPLFHLPLLGDIYGLNLLPLLLIVAYYFQMKFTSFTQPTAGGADDQQAQIQKMSRYMIFLFPIFLYNEPSGLNLYIFASTFGGLIDTWLVRKTLKKRGILPTKAPALPPAEQPA